MTEFNFWDDRTHQAEKEHPFPGNELRQVDEWNDYEGGHHIRKPVADINKAHIVTSINVDTTVTEVRHRPVLDIDFPAKLIKSTTEGHYHLYLDKDVSNEDYMKLLDVLADVGIIERKHAEASKTRGYTAVRLPWIRKEET